MYYAEAIVRSVHIYRIGHACTSTNINTILQYILYLLMSFTLGRKKNYAIISTQSPIKQTHFRFFLAPSVNFEEIKRTFPFLKSEEETLHIGKYWLK